MLKFLCILIFCVLINLVTADKYVHVTTSNGQIKGKTMKSRGGLTIFSFRGIPYAKPPIGNLRFKAPVKVPNWVGTLDATRDAPICLQKDFVFHGRNPEIEGSEDCLFLNVYTPTIKKTKKLPVIVEIHDGSFQVGNSKITRIWPHYLLDKDVVFVSFNYRLGIFGFYTTLDDASPGNYGLKDQLMVLHWVQKNINKFGGDPNLVTIHGVSAGSVSVHHHLLSPRSQGLFHRAIASSGTAINFWGQALNFVQKDFFRPAAQSVGCNGTTVNIIKCMRKVSANQLLLLADAFRNYNNDPLMLYNIVKEKRSKLNPDPFLEEETPILIQKGNFNKVPFIIGMAQDEGILSAASWLLREDLFDKLRLEFNEIVPNLILPAYATSQDKIPELWEKFKEFYFNNKNISIEDPETIKGFIDLFTDAYFSYGFYQAVLYHSYNGYKDLWMYNFGYKGKGLSYRQSYASTNRTIDFDFGVAHMDDMIYLIPNTEVLPGLPSSDFKISEIMVEIWTYFALHGEPPKLDDGDCSLDWMRIKNIEGKAPIKNKYLNFLNITKSLEDDCPVSMKMQKGFLKEKMRFWNSLDLNFQIKDVTWE